MTTVVWLKCGDLSLIVGENVADFDGLPNCLALSFLELDRLLWWIGHQRWFERQIPHPFPVEHLKALAAVKFVFPGSSIPDLLEEITNRKR